MPVHIRPLTDADCDDVLAINESVVHKLAPMGPPEYRWFVDSAACAWAAEVDGRIAGFVLVLDPGQPYDSANYAWFSERYDDFLYLDRVAIADGFRRQGIGAAVYQAVEAVADASGRPVLLEVNIEPRNDASLAFHAARGFTSVGTLEHPGGKVVTLMVRPPAPT